MPLFNNCSIFNNTLSALIFRELKFTLQPLAWIFKVYKIKVHNNNVMRN